MILLHMADALISPAVGAAMWAASAGFVAYSTKKTGDSGDERKTPLMGAVGAFVFAAQMINFTIPATGSSGHLVGSILLAALLGRHAAFLTIASILTVQALFFADGGLLALGCNIFNMGVIPCYIAYPLVYKRILGGNPTGKSICRAAVCASVIGLQLGALGVVAEVTLSAVTQLPTGIFLLLMQPIHLAIGIAEGFITAAVVMYVFSQRPEIIKAGGKTDFKNSYSLRPLFAAFIVTATVIAGGLSLFASSYPDGLEWSIMRAGGQEELETPAGGVYEALAQAQEKFAFFPDYAFAGAEETDGEPPAFSAAAAGVAGVALSFAAAFLLGKAARIGYRKKHGVGTVV
ncbi:MAG: energy-coupling factor ABC transporter permease [Acidaminococcales bacterium]|jgi:cobalt/nickel transport system permease protein|nr:energy-coupling factor ABC transporter permease [Acidaminococcales bacterium]